MLLQGHVKKVTKFGDAIELCAMAIMLSLSFVVDLGLHHLIVEGAWWKILSMSVCCTGFS
jgi:ABC-type antimicrobial peptide transport system permease subunit